MLYRIVDKNKEKCLDRREHFSLLLSSCRASLHIATRLALISNL